MSLLNFERQTVLQFKVVRKVTHKDLSEVKRRRKKSHKRHYKTCYFKWRNTSLFLRLSVTYTHFSKITQMAQQYKYRVLLLQPLAMKQKAFILKTENQLVLREKIKGSILQKRLERYYENYLLSMKCYRKAVSYKKNL